MSVEAIGLVTFAIGVLTFFLGAEFAFWAFMPLTLLGSAGAVLLGGAGTIQPAHLMLGFLAIAVFVDPKRMATLLRSTTFPREGFWLAVAVVYGLAGAFLLPRMFAGATSVNAVGSTDYGPSLLLVPLGPTSGNITQSVYLVADFICFMTVLAYTATARNFENAAKVILAYCATNIGFAAVDLATSTTGTGFLLGFIRNADYQLHVEEVTGGMKRIVGSFTEASSFSYATVGSLGFTARLCLAGRWPRATAILSLVSLALLALSTSSTAYVATPVLLALLYAGSLVRVARGGASPLNLAFLAFAPLALLLAVVAVALDPSASASLGDFMNTTLWEKSASQSGLERAQWNQTALLNFRDTFGLGGGLGSIRASSFPLAVLSNLGVVGALGFVGFFARVLSPTSHRGDSSFEIDVRAAARMSCAGLLIAATASGALVDLGLPFYVFAALACARPRQEPVSRVVMRKRSVALPIQS